jgi:hypothetical protein
MTEAVKPANAEEIDKSLFGLESCRSPSVEYQIGGAA